MADEVRTQDILPVMSRVSWGAIFAGAFVALAVYVLLSVLGLAIGLSAAPELSGETIGTGAAIWYIVSLFLALFAGGCVTTQCTAGENKMEAVVYGVVLWGVMFAMTMWVTGSVLRTGAGMALGAGNVAASSIRVDWERLAQQTNLSQEQIDEVRAAMPTAAQAREMGSEAAWWTLGGIIFSMVASIAGALVGAGPTLVFRGVALRPTAIEPRDTGFPSPTR
jgi:hypothetical protein